MAITNRYSNLSFNKDGRTDNDSEFGANLNRSISTINTSNPAGISNSYSERYSNAFGASARYSTNEQKLVQAMVTETINVNGITVRYMPRHAEDRDEVWNEEPSSMFHRGFQADMLLTSATGFEGEGTILTQYGVEFKEEVILQMSIPRFDELTEDFKNQMATDSRDSDFLAAFERERPLEGDIIVIPFGRSARNQTQYFPKFFEIVKVTTFQDGAFFQLGDNFQYQIQGRLFELSGEDFEVAPTVIDHNTGEVIFNVASTDTSISDSEAANIIADSDTIKDAWADNRDIEIRAQQRNVYNTEGDLVHTQEVVEEDYTARAFGFSGIINNLDEI